MEQIAIVDVLRNHMRMIVLLCIVAALGGYASTYFITERYQATALVLVRPQQPVQLDSRNVNHNLLDFPVTQSMSVETPSKTYIEIIKSESLIRRVVQGFDLGANDDKSNGFLGHLLGEQGYQSYLNLKARLAQIGKDTLSLLKYGRTFPNDPGDDAVKEVSENLTLKSLEDTFVFEIDYAGKNPQMSALVANRLANSFVDSMEQVRHSDAQSMRDKMASKLAETQQALARARQHVESQNHSTSTLLDLKSQELDLKSAEDDYQSALKDFQGAEKNLADPLPEVRVVSEAVAPRFPSSPIRVKISGISLLGGLMVGVGLAFFLESVNRRIRSVADVEDFVGVTVLATIPRVSRSRLRGG